VGENLAHNNFKEYARMRKKIFWVVQILLVLSMLMAACSSAATPQAADPQVATPQVVKETVVVTKEVPVEVTKEVVVEKPPSEVTLTVLNPQGPIEAVAELAPRLGTLDGKKVAFWLSATADETYAGQGGPFFDKLQELLKAQFPQMEVVNYTDLPMKYSPADEVIAAITATQPDAVIVGFGG